MPLQEFVKGDRVAYLVKKAAGFEACCGTVVRLNIISPSNTLGAMTRYILMIVILMTTTVLKTVPCVANASN